MSILRNPFVRGRRASRPASGSTPAGPLAAVRGAIAEGEASRAEIAARTGLSRSTVDAAIAHLERTGALRRERMASSCPSGGCSGCAHATADGAACSSGGAGHQRGPVALVLTRRP